MNSMKWTVSWTVWTVTCSAQQHVPFQFKLGVVLALGAATCVAVDAGGERDFASPGEA